jgi:hypothetical protein
MMYLNKKTRNAYRVFGRGTSWTNEEMVDNIKINLGGCELLLHKVQRLAFV